MIRKYKLIRKYAKAFLFGLSASSIYGRILGPKVLMNCVPKSGTHLIEQVLINMPYLSKQMGSTLSGHCDDFVMARVNKISRGKFMAAHVTASESDLQKVNDDIKIIMMIRDPRDIAVSHFKYVSTLDINHPSSRYFLDLPDDDARLMAVIEGVEGVVEPLWTVLEKYLSWIESERVCVVRFEELVGAKGGGDDSIQQQTVMRIAKYLEVPLSIDQVKIISNMAFSEKSLTFRSPQVGNWRSVFKPEHTDAIVRTAGMYIERYGYQL